MLSPKGSRNHVQTEEEIADEISDETIPPKTKFLTFKAFRLLVLYRSRIWLRSGPFPIMTTLHSQTSSKRAIYFLQASGKSS